MSLARWSSVSYIELNNPDPCGQAWGSLSLYGILKELQGVLAAYLGYCPNPSLSKAVNWTSKRTLWVPSAGLHDNAVAAAGGSHPSSSSSTMPLTRAMPPGTTAPAPSAAGVSLGKTYI